MAKTRTPAAPKPVEALVQHALKLAATNPEAKWLGKSAATLFSTKEANHEAAIAECTKPEAPLLKQVDKGGVLTAEGFARAAGDLTDEEVRATFEQLVGKVPEEQAGAVAKVAAARVPLGERVAFIQSEIGRTSLAAAELTPLLEEAVAAEKAEHEKRIADAAKRQAAHDAAMKALDRAKQLLTERQQNLVDALRREWEALGQ